MNAQPRHRHFDEVKLPQPKSLRLPPLEWAPAGFGRGRKNGERFDQVGFSGRVGSDQNVEGLQLQLRGPRAIRQKVLQTNGANELEASIAVLYHAFPLRGGGSAPHQKPRLSSHSPSCLVCRRRPLGSLIAPRSQTTIASGEPDSASTGASECVVTNKGIK